jgi:hypothetical protein
MPVFISSETIPKSMQEDLQLLEEMSADDLSKATNLLAQATGILAPDAAYKLLKPDFGEPKGKAIARLLASLRRAPKDFYIELWSRIEPRSDDSLERLKENLTQLDQSFPAIDAYAKVEDIAMATGQVASGLRIICDLRPVFDDEADRIEAAIPVATLVLETREGKTISCQLPSDALRELRNHLDRADKKLKILREEAKKLPSETHSSETAE